jgi:hypothetical protein
MGIVSTVNSCEVSTWNIFPHLNSVCSWTHGHLHPRDSLLSGHSDQEQSWNFGRYSQIHYF